MEKYRAIVHYHFKKGMENQAIKFLENELFKKARELGCHEIEIIQDEKDPAHCIGMGVWNSFEEAKNFQSLWNEKEKQLGQYCLSIPHREFYKIKLTFKEKENLRKSA